MSASLLKNLPVMFNVNGWQPAFGVKAEWADVPIVNVPEGGRVVRRRFRMGRIGQAFVQSRGQTTQHYLALANGGLKLCSPIGVNSREDKC